MNPLQTINRALLSIHITLAVLWIYQGLVPKLIFKVIEEQQFWQFTGIQFLSIPRLIELSGIGEIIFGVLFLIFRQSKMLHYLNIVAMLFFIVVVAVVYPHYFVQGFNPFIMNTAMAALSIVALQLLNIPKDL
ncbi:MULTISPECIES: DoxX-like family protein [unclassified Acinetobacter]|uniref:DoxX-like family protein n=1 Tax=Acinetobacter TaxID=469 RepID=UPI0018AAF516|nr:MULTISPECIES: DoxX-like family protein [unclassified Acinetobacter]MBJ9952403.1 DoxX-like family protein [Acinetobacter baumannii]